VKPAAERKKSICEVSCRATRRPVLMVSRGARLAG